MTIVIKPFKTMIDMKKLDLMKWVLWVLLFLMAEVQMVEAKKREVVRGMTKQEVRSILGKPRLVSFDERLERWEYLKTKGSLVDNFLVVIWVDFDQNDRVVRYQCLDRDATFYGQQRVTPLPADPYRHRDVGHGMGRFEYLDAASFGILYNKVKKANFDDNRLDLLEVACLRCYFSSEQCGRILSLFSFNHGKMEALRLMNPRLVDRRNEHLILDQFTFGSDKEKASLLLRGY